MEGKQVTMWATLAPPPPAYSVNIIEYAQSYPSYAGGSWCIYSPAPHHYWLWAASGGIHSGTSSLHCVQQNIPHDRGLQMLADFLFLDIHVPSVTHYLDPIHSPLSK